MLCTDRRIKVFAEFVKQLATLSKCSDRGVAAIAIDKYGTQIYSIGINGGPKKGIDCLCLLGNKYTCIHAEAQCIAKCTTLDQEKIMLCTLSPCVTCASLIINTGFIAVYYIEEYKDTAGLELLESANIKIVRLEV